MKYQVCEYTRNPNEDGIVLKATDDIAEATGELWKWRSTRNHPYGLVCVLERLEDDNFVLLATVSSNTEYCVYTDSMDVTEMVIFQNTWGFPVSDVILAIEESCGLDESSYYTYDGDFRDEDFNADLSRMLTEMGCPVLENDI